MFPGSCSCMITVGSQSCCHPEEFWHGPPRSDLFVLLLFMQASCYFPVKIFFLQVRSVSSLFFFAGQILCPFLAWLGMLYLLGQLQLPTVTVMLSIFVNHPFVNCAIGKTDKQTKSKVKLVIGYFLLNILNVFFLGWTSNSSQLKTWLMAECCAMCLKAQDHSCKKRNSVCCRLHF